ncbi:GLUTAMATE-1-SEMIALDEHYDE 21-AMINOMUTASE [Salix viminalis]|uniref:glutamate-1-semialdehyde 2,1-aminomutase n=1 Tax=Salix viminalis TaxID=40686 RepID=A0A9Q0SGR1_SALVM|nr:GLUTAMATE-1-SEMIALDEHYDE 21-AMINOMUTASE [Salix viminalis]
MASTITAVSVGLGLSRSSTRKLTQTRNPSSSRLSFCSIKMAVSVEEEKKKKSFTLEKSEEAFSAAKEMMPGGVNSPVRAFKSVGGQPILFDSVKGSHMRDIDGNEYIDYVGSWGPAIIGHADDKVLAALAETMKKGTSFGAPCLLENVLAEMVIKAVPSIEMVRFVNSGTEACMGVLRLARAYTGREKIIKFEGCYHGHADPFLVKAGSGVATLGLPDSPGVPKAATYETLTAPYNDIAAVENLFENNKGDICGIILEPVVGNAGFIPPQPEFISALRRITEENNALLIFDEVMTGFRLSYGGAQEYFGITPDLTTLGKIIGGGLPGIHTLKRLQEPGSYEYLEKITSELVQGIIDAGKKTGHAICGGNISGMFGFFFTEGPVHNFADAKKSDTGKFARFYQGMLREGVYFAPSQFEAGFTSLAHTAEDIQKTIAAAEKVLRQI